LVIATNYLIPRNIQQHLSCKSLLASMGGKQCPCFVWLLSPQCLLLNHFGTLASICCNWYCSVTKAHLAAVVVIDAAHWIWHSCHCLCNWICWINTALATKWPSV